MKRTAAMLAAGLAAAVTWTTALQASGDIGCASRWKLRHTDLTGCDNMIMLSPGNDTRVNLALLLSRAPRPMLPSTPDAPAPTILFDWEDFSTWAFSKPDDVGDARYASGEGSRCLSDAAGAVAFAAAVNDARRVSAAERKVLLDARRALRPNCDGAKVADDPMLAADMVKSRSARAFVRYLSGASAFYAGDFDAASTEFQALASSSEPWLADTARYMLGRVEVNRAQIGAFDEYGYRDEKHPVDTKVTAAAEGALRAYLQSFPKGRYVISARGLLRRVYWLAGDIPKLAAEYEALLRLPPDQRGLDDAALAQELDDKLLPDLTVKDARDPILLAVLDLRSMRKGEAGENLSASLEAQRARFANAPALFEYLIAAHAFYVANAPRGTLDRLPDAATRGDFDTVSFSRQMLRGMALNATGDTNARTFWLDLIRNATHPLQRTTAELGFALHAERTGEFDALFAEGSPVRDATIRDTLLVNVGSLALLRRQASGAGIDVHERAVARFALIYKDLTRGRYRDFLRDVDGVAVGTEPKAVIYDFVGKGDPSSSIFVNGAMGEDYPCPVLKASVARLADAPGDAKANLCVAEFVRLNGLDGYFLDKQPPVDELGGTRSQFAGTTVHRLDRYRAVITDPKTPPADRAYALYRGVRCYAPSRNNECGGDGVPPAMRKAWFQRLHRDYPNSRWAQDLPYYW